MERARSESDGPRAGSPSHLAQSNLVTFDDFYNEHLLFVWRNARRLLGFDSLVDDVVQEVFLVAHRRLPEFDWKGSPRAWLFAILRRVVSDHRRSQRRRGEGHGGDGDVDGIAARDSHPDRKVEKAQALRLLYAYLEQLDDAKREVFILAEFEQMTAPEIGEALGISNVTTVRARLRDARRQIGELVERQQRQEGRSR
jgi:RNA polymerase sigma-70 factor (ECF subfamily)